MTQFIMLRNSRNSDFYQGSKFPTDNVLYLLGACICWGPRSQMTIEKMPSNSTGVPLVRESTISPETCGAYIVCCAMHQSLSIPFLD